MIIKNFRIASRFLLKHKEYTAINILGLTLSLVCVLFIGLYIYDELSFDRFHSKGDRIYRVIEHATSREGTATKSAYVAYRISTLGDQLPSIEQTASIRTFGRVNVYTEDSETKGHEDFTVTNQGFFDLFDFKFIHGPREHALSEAYTVVLTKSMAERLFGITDVVNRLIRVDRDDQPYRVSAVIEDFPSNSHLQANMLFSLETFATNQEFQEGTVNDWSSSSFATYVLVKSNTDAGQLQNSITGVVLQNRKEDAPKTSFTLQPMTDIHFYSADINARYAASPGEIYYLYIFGAVGCFILFIACINYINLSTSLSISRGKEVGVKKVAGAAQRNLIGQFITESNLISFTALIFSLMLVNILLPGFNSFLGKGIRMEFLWDYRVFLALVGFTLIIGTLAGSYPAFILSSVKPAVAIKGFSKASRSSGRIRQGLVVFQFTLTITLIFATLIAFRQLSFIQNTNLGFQKEQLVVLDINSGAVRRGFETIKTEIAKIPAVKSVSVSSRVPGEWKNMPQVMVELPASTEPKSIFFLSVDDDFFPTFEMELISGRNFSDLNPSDSLSLIINETAARELGFKDPLSETMTITTTAYGNRLEIPFEGKIIGIVRDFHFQSLHEKIGPMVLAFRNNPIHAIDYFNVRLLPGDWQAGLKDMEKILQSIDPSHLLEYNFLDEKLAEFYRQDTKRGQLFAISAGVSIGLACLGLFSLASFMTEQRTKEVGIRKALGATSGQIVMMLTGSYVKLVLLGFILATPLAVWALGKWLQSFAYQVDIGWETVTLACAFTLLIVLSTVGYKSLKAAAENPVKSLRSE
jgi:putative ABC transport system permease protein